LAVDDTVGEVAEAVDRSDVAVGGSDVAETAETAVAGPAKKKRKKRVKKKKKAKAVEGTGAANKTEEKATKTGETATETAAAVPDTMNGDKDASAETKAKKPKAKKKPKKSEAAKAEAAIVVKPSVTDEDLASWTMLGLDKRLATYLHQQGMVEPTGIQVQLYMFSLSSCITAYHALSAH
jgi:Ca2+-dependent lipid-binding protein